MAAIPRIVPKRRTDEELAAKLRRLIEGCFDDMGLSEAERDMRYEALDRSLDANDASLAK